MFEFKNETISMLEYYTYSGIVLMFEQFYQNLQNSIIDLMLSKDKME